MSISDDTSPATKGDIKALLDDFKGELRSDLAALKEDGRSMRSNLTVLKDDGKLMRNDLNALKNDGQLTRSDLTALKDDVQSFKGETKLSFESLREDIRSFREINQQEHHEIIKIIQLGNENLRTELLHEFQILLEQ